MNEQREIIYRRRNEILDQESIHENVLKDIKNYVNNWVFKYLNSEEENKYGQLVDFTNKNILKKEKLKLNDIDTKDIEEVTEYIYLLLNDEYEAKISELPWEIVNEFEKAIALRVIDLNGKIIKEIKNSKN